MVKMGNRNVGAVNETLDNVMGPSVSGISSTASASLSSVP